ncbi:MAG: preprotein translocase subunit SecE [Candidatus Omnitrophota bacterium]|nr:MAG: preprotein translocase subunit SecE [Candidatus Omnitrophota bacterium]
MFAKTTNFLKEVKVELKKVSWPDKNELLGSTTVVIISVIILALFIGICDFIFSKAMQIIIR